MLSRSRHTGVSWPGTQAAGMHLALLSWSDLVPFLVKAAHRSTASQLSNTVVYLIRAISGLEGINLQSCFAFPSLGRCTNPLKASDLQSQTWPSCPPLQLTSLQEFVEDSCEGAMSPVSSRHLGTILASTLSFLLLLVAAI